MDEHSDDLFELDARKPFQELDDTCAGFEVFEQGSYGNTRTFEHPSAANFLAGALYFWTLYPIKHGYILCFDKIAEQEALSIEALAQGSSWRFALYRSY